MIWLTTTNNPNSSSTIFLIGIPALVDPDGKTVFYTLPRNVMSCNGFYRMILQVGNSVYAMILGLYMGDIPVANPDAPPLLHSQTLHLHLVIYK